MRALSGAPERRQRLSSEDGTDASSPLACQRRAVWLFHDPQGATSSPPRPSSYYLHTHPATSHVQTPCPSIPKPGFSFTGGFSGFLRSPSAYILFPGSVRDRYEGNEEKKWVPIVVATYVQSSTQWVLRATLLDAPHIRTMSTVPTSTPQHSKQKSVFSGPFLKTWTQRESQH